MLANPNSIVFATENPAKLDGVRRFANSYGIEVLSPSQAGLIPVEVEETGETYKDNARLKVEAYLGQSAAKEVIICGDDSGIEITALGGAPGIHTRRWKDGITRMTDDEIVDYALEQLAPFSDRSATFRSTVAFSRYGGPIEYADGSQPGFIATEPFSDPGANQEGAPFKRLFVVNGHPPIPSWEFSNMTREQRGDRLTHREAAFIALFEAITAKD